MLYVAASVAGNWLGNHTFMGIRAGYKTSGPNRGVISDCVVFDKELIHIYI